MSKKHKRTFSETDNASGAASTSPTASIVPVEAHRPTVTERIEEVHATAEAGAILEDIDLLPAASTLRACATITSCPNSLNNRLTHGECIPVSSAIRLRGIPPKTAFIAFGVVASFCSRNYFPRFIQNAT